ncbi:MAG: manganese efflux pump [Oscillospiraceae bacterium]|nr:manganese efflux pump [Oscillospiraceae bacterium]
MSWNFFINSVLLGFGLAMDAFSVSIANGLHDPQMKTQRMCLIAGTFGFFQFLMPMIGWGCVRFLAEAFTAFQPFIPWIALLLLSYIGAKMILEALHGEAMDASGEIAQPLTCRQLVIQGIATSIDALSTGFAIADYHWAMALAASLIIAAVTFAVCMIGVRIGKRFGMMLARRASVLGGVILILIGIEILLSHLL